MDKRARGSEKPPRWGSRLGVILAVSGSAVGLGNFLRFPGQAVQNGGGAFMIPYLCAILFLAMPIAWAEWGMGRYGGRKGFHSAPGILGVVGRGRIARYLGVLAVLIPLTVYMYYACIESWCLRYAFEYLRGGVDLGPDPTAYAARAAGLFQSFTGAAANGSVFEGRMRASVVFWLIVMVLNVYLVHRGLSGGIEKFCLAAMPAMSVIATVVLVRVLTLDTPDPAHPERNVLGGLGFMWNPDFGQLADPKTWLAAAGQIFFSLSVGFGVILHYASYLRRQDDVVLSALAAASTNELFEVGFGGLITIPAAFVFLGTAGTSGGTFGLGFHTMPVVFAHMGAVGSLVGFAWFCLLFLAAITSSISMLQPVKVFVEETLNLSARQAAALVTALAGLGSVWVLYFSQDLVALDTMDFWVGTVATFVVATVQIVCFGWVLGIGRGIRELHEGALMHLPRFFRFAMKYVTPVYLLAVFVAFGWWSLPGYLGAMAESRVAKLTLGLVGVVAAMLVVMTVIGEKRWRAAGLDLDGRKDNGEERPPR